MRYLDEAPRDASVTRPPKAPAPESVPMLPSEDQEAFNVSLEAGIRSLGALVRKRRTQK